MTLSIRPLGNALGAESIYLNPIRIETIDGMPEAETQDLLYDFSTERRMHRIMIEGEQPYEEGTISND